jgi:uncharacterized protein
LPSWVAQRSPGVEAHKFEDNETSFDQRTERIGKTLVFLETLDLKAIDGAMDREISFPLGQDDKGHMKVADYLNHFVLANFCFHLTAGDGIIRHCGAYATHNRKPRRLRNMGTAHRGIRIRR